jgi:hypothetical protein
MDRKIAEERYIYFQDALNRLALFSISKIPTIDELKMGKHMVQKAYRDLKSLDLDFDNLVDYFCYLSTLHLAYQWEEHLLNKPTILQSLLSEQEEKEENFQDTITNIFSQITTLIFFNHWDYQNLIRLFLKDPKYLFHAEPFENINNKVKELIYKNYAVMGKKEWIVDFLIKHNIYTMFSFLRLIFYYYEKDKEMEDQRSGDKKKHGKQPLDPIIRHRKQLKKFLEELYKVFFRQLEIQAKLDN